MGNISMSALVLPHFPRPSQGFGHCHFSFWHYEKVRLVSFASTERFPSPKSGQTPFKRQKSIPEDHRRHSLIDLILYQRICGVAAGGKEVVGAYEEHHHSGFVLLGQLSMLQPPPQVRRLVP
jgi:hypothetical protein